MFERLLERTQPSPSRRAFLTGTAAVLVCGRLHAQPPTSLHGKVNPALPLPDFDMLLANGSETTLHRILDGQATAIQLMFTACRTTCPMEGAIFEKVQKLIPDRVQRKLQLLSVSVGAGGEKPGDLQAWMRRYNAQPGWIAAAPAPKDLPSLLKLFGQGRSPTDPHTTQVQIVDRSHQLVWRTSELPAAAEVSAILTRI